jgi:methionyl-tRNA synthetase
MRFDPPPLLLYFCSECGLLLKQTEIELKHAQLGRRGGKEEECPKCGSLLSHTMQQRRRKREGGHAPLVTEREEGFSDIPSHSSSFIPGF